MNIKQISVIVTLLLYLIFLIWFSRKFFKEPKLRDFVLGSFTDPATGKGSGKSLTAFIFAQIIALSTLFALIYSENHILPEYFLISILAFVGGLYGIKMASKYFGGTDDTTSSSSSTTTSTSVITEEVKKEKEKKINEGEDLNKKEDLG